MQIQNKIINPMFIIEAWRDETKLSVRMSSDPKFPKVFKFETEDEAKSELNAIETTMQRMLPTSFL